MIMIKARHATWARFIFEPYLNHIFRKHFHLLQWPESFPEENGTRSILLVANHFSWWDGFFWYKANQILFKKKFHIMMLEDQLERFWFFRYLGAFSVRKNSRYALKSLEYAAELLEDPENLVVIFPQGSIHVPWAKEVHTGKGAERLWKRAHTHSRLFYGNVLTHYGANPKPTATFFVEEASSVQGFAAYCQAMLHKTEKEWKD